MMELLGCAFRVDRRGFSKSLFWRDARFWDFGYGFSGNAPFISSFIVLAATLVMTVFTVLAFLL
jgi:hypothetical protein